MGTRLTRLIYHLKIYEDSIPRVTHSILKICAELVLFVGSLYGLWLLLQNLLIAHFK